jgi:hypothetical protein
MRSIVVLAAAAMISLGAYAQGPQSGQDHAARHPGGGATSAAAAAAAEKTPTKGPAKPNAAAPAPSSASGGMSGDTRHMHDQMHEPGGMHERMHAKDGQVMGGMPAASAASR